MVEGVAFMFIECDAVPLPVPTAGIEVRLNFSGPSEGAIWLALSVEDSNRLAAGMLGRPLAETETLGPDQAAPAEFLNILGNWVLDALWGSEAPFQVAVPSVEAKQLDNTVVWSLPAARRAIVLTDAECTILCGITLNQEDEASQPREPPKASDELC